MYFEGPDQHRGWFNSSLMVSVGLTDTPRTPTCSRTAGCSTRSGRAMHKSIGNVVAPLDVIAKYGAEIVRWWALATDWRNDVRIGDEILQRVADAYRKVRNTFRFLLGNLSDFDPRTDGAAVRCTLTRVDRAFAGLLAARLARIQAATERARLPPGTRRPARPVHGGSVGGVSSTSPRTASTPTALGSPERRSAQTVLWTALHDLAIAASPALVFTAEEAWQHHPALVTERAERAPAPSGRARRLRADIGESSGRCCSRCAPR